MDDVRDDVIIAHRFETDPHVFGVWHKYFDSTFVIAACILMLTALVIYVVHRYRLTRVLWGFRQSSFMIRPIFSITRRNVVFLYATSQLENNQQLSNHVSTCASEGVLPSSWLETLHTSFVGASLQMEKIECDIQMMRRGCSVFVFLFFCFFFFGVTVFYILTIMTMLIYIVA